MSFTQEKETNLHTGPNGQIIDATREAPYEDGVIKSAKQRAIELAHEIVKFCDNYKVK